ncbi:antibiotic biosynthesis monooxygenase family protein [Marinomonas mediterranea]|uniref:antibiotic biosynthesis monooxygenase family protein n=1 Tax=Marinomonas mediterranea TaxID=119864 RepID=UPI002349B87C|nr:antibiotic biosynthesis monooxygenase family protein [Marinomonas mediterranea]WCN10276.1 antibiotic biosynthesis monooxygenase [Marinomonas mediterranea]
MIYEVAEMSVLIGQEEYFEKAVYKASQHFKEAKGCIGLKLERSIETPNHYRLIVGWNTVEDHMVTFKNSEGFKKWRELASPFFEKPPKVEHVKQVLEAF